MKRLGMATLALSALLASAADSHAARPPELRVAQWTLNTGANWRAGSLDGLSVVRGDDGDDMLTVVGDHETGHFTSPVHRAPFPFTAAALFWTADTRDGRGIAVGLRLSRDRATWSRWYPIHHPETQIDGHTYGENIVALDGAQFVQVRVTLNALTPTRSPSLNSLTVVLIDASDAPTRAQALAASSPPGSSAIDRPAIIPRQAWGANPAYLDWDPEYMPVQRTVLHHTVTAGGVDPVAEVQAIYYYHAVIRGWGDIGYNYLVDQHGGIYEGRYGGDDVIGAHTARWNSGAMGVALLGCYDSQNCAPGQSPSAPGQEAIANLAAWAASRRVFDPRQTETFTNAYGDPPMINHRLAGHRDYRQYIEGEWYNATTCPGDTLYSELAALRSQAWSRLPNNDVRFEEHGTPARLDPGQVISVSLTLRNAGKVSWTPGDVTLGYRWFDQAGTPILQVTDAALFSTTVPFAGALPLTATLSALPVTGTYRLNWDLNGAGAGWFGELSAASDPLDVSVDVRFLTERLYLPLILGSPAPESCAELLANGGAETDIAWEFLGGWPGAYSTVHVRSGNRAIRLGVESVADDGLSYSSAQQTLDTPHVSTHIALNFWRYSTSSNTDNDRVYVALLDGSDGLLDTLRLAASDARDWRPATFDLTSYRGQTLTLRFTVLNNSPPGITADWLDDISLTACGP